MGDRRKKICIGFVEQRGNRTQAFTLLKEIDIGKVVGPQGSAFFYTGDCNEL